MPLGVQGKWQEEGEKGGHFTGVAGIALREHLQLDLNMKFYISTLGMRLYEYDPVK